MNVLQETRVIQLNKMIGLSPTARPSNKEVRLAALLQVALTMFFCSFVCKSLQPHYTDYLIDNSQAASQVAGCTKDCDKGWYCRDERG